MGGEYVVAMSKWTAADVPDQSGRVAIVTGSNTAHPGGSNTELTRNTPGVIRAPLDLVWGLIAQSAEMGALPTLRAATDPGVQGGQYYGPDGIGEQRGHPKLVQSSARSHDEDVQRRLWSVSEELTGITFPV
jgi:hypothetical protein